ncbi:MAG TPA: hypothetical protein EYP56_02040, partial [Planctomycetaceae bacterium]|nr:hypothetical protein [Planctomycetaceae bacterium]
MDYEHTQKAPLAYVLVAAALAALAIAWVGRDEPAAWIVAVGVAATLVLVAAMFSHLTVRDEGHCLAIRY